MQYLCGTTCISQIHFNKTFQLGFTTYSHPKSAFALSIQMVLKAKMGMLQSMNAIKMLATMAHNN